jgi:hypothetical protein
MNNQERLQLARDTKAIVALAFRNGPIESLHAGESCPVCAGKSGYSKISDSDMAWIMTNAVNHLYSLLRLKAENPAKYASEVQFGERYTAGWDQPIGLEDLDEQP